jgi:DNA-binding SARP family transcriptional activator/TolB-like protein
MERVPALSQPPPTPPPGPQARRPPDGGVSAQIALLDGFSVSCGEQAIRIRSRKAQALLAFLILEGAASASRERLCGLLWSETSEEKARASLRQTVHGLREDLGEAGEALLQIERGTVRLSAGWTSDVAVILEQARKGGIDPRLQNQQRLIDTLLAGFEDIDPAFRVWLLVQRESIGNAVTRALTSLLAESGALNQAREAARALLNLDPTNEEACRHLMEDAAARGDTATALKIYKKLWDLLDQEYGTEPSGQTQALIVRIKNGEITPAPPKSSPTADAPSGGASVAPAETTPWTRLDDHPYLIVSSFDFAGLDGHSLHLVSGLRHELIARLVRFREWSVLDGSSASIDAGALPGRCFSIDATLRPGGSKLSLTLTTKEQPSGRYIWSDSFTIDYERWFDVEPLLLRQIAMAVNVQLTAERLRANVKAAAIPAGVSESWLQGQQVILGFNAEEWDRVASIYRSITVAAPSFSPAYSALAQIGNARHLVFPGTRKSPESTTESLRLANVAVQLDPFDSRAHLAHAWALAFSERWAQAEHSVDLALKLNENDPWTLISAALAAAFCGRHDAALDCAEQALRLSPQPPPVHWAYQATLRFVCEDYAGAAEAAERAGNAISNLPGWHAASLAHLGEQHKAREQAALFVKTLRERWHGESPTNEAITEWFLSAFPIRLEADRSRLREGLALAFG